ncbi:hypothetical protein PA598K_00210 [Paenibacillus sp. 598K]|uniref:FtsW/RodA/SpoVE family cell cycle protein n=1 Tax=Paenibacillus sp. 598K TaxID=1117987 RepID=UPI000FFA2240|nr:FtsW/RodA/SpoVE family cell cycle protein [Paenibacillus sp. 598K]GBF71980.1 hypothetical protein PA598K_00210 [Paenibacillus sp. 598K]
MKRWWKRMTASQAVVAESRSTHTVLDGATIGSPPAAEQEAQSQPVAAFLQTVCEQIRTKKAHRSVRRELEGHIADLVEELMAEGMERQEAERVAIARMGDARDIGRQLNEVHKPVIEWGLIGIVATMLGLGLFYMYVAELQYFVSQSNLFAKQAVFAVIGLLMAAMIWWVDYRKLQALGEPCYVIAIGLLLLLQFTSPVNGSKAYMNFSFISFNGALLSLFLLVISAAAMEPAREWTLRTAAMQLILRLGVPSVLFIMTNTRALLVLYVAAFFVQVWFTRRSALQVTALITSSGLLALPVLFMTHTSVHFYLERLTAFLRPDDFGNYLQVNFQSVTEQAGWLGHGPVAMERSLPLLESEGLFMLMIHTYGWLMGIGFAALVLTFIVRAAIIASKVRDPFGKLLIAGLVSTMGLQFVWSILMSLGWAPFAGVSMPLVSYGGTSLLLHMLAIGLILSVAKQQRTLSSERSRSLVGKRV